MKLLAPNGKPSNLTPEQYKLVRTPEFKAWFGDWEKAYKLAITQNKGAKYGLIKENILWGWQQNDKIIYLNHPAYKNVSKVLDENGEPLVVYHGTKASFNVFNLGNVTNKEWKEVKDAQFRSGADPTTFVGSHFAKEYSVAREFAIEKKYKKIKGSIASELIEKEVGSIKSFFLNIKSIFLYDELNRPIDEYDWQKDMQSQYVSDIKKYISSIDISQDLFLDNYRDFIENYKESYEFRQQVHTLVMSVGDILSIRLAEKLGKMYRDMISKKYNGEYFPDQENKKFDGIVYKNYWEGGTSYCVWDATQIKLADGTNTTFDFNNPDIRFDDGGITITDEFSTQSYDFGNVGYSIKKNNLEVGQIQYNINKEKGIVSIYLLEVLEKGIGAKVINYFFNNGINIIYGDAVDSIKFWEKMGAKFDEFNEDINGYPFTISKEDFVQTKYYENTNPDVRFENGGELNLTSEQVEQKLGRKLHWWNDDVVTIQGSQYKKVFLKSEYRKI